MRRSIAMVVVLLLGLGVSTIGQSIYKANVPMPTEYSLWVISDEELVLPLRQAFPRASFEDGGLRLYLPDNFSLVPVNDFKGLAAWYWENTAFQTSEDSVIGLVGLASSLAPWSKVPIGFAVRQDQFPSPYIYVVFITRDAGRLVVYRIYYNSSGSVVCELISQPDCLVRLVVIF